jgi:hypothetical protein
LGPSTDRLVRLDGQSPDKAGIWKAIAWMGLSGIAWIDRGMPCGGIMPRSELADGSGNLAAAADRWARRGGEILVLGTDEPQVDYRQPSAEGLPRDDVIEGAEDHVARISARAQ